jgi:hypothetical protein
MLLIEKRVLRTYLLHLQAVGWIEQEERPR